MDIVQLPVEVLMHISNFLPTYNEVSLVNKLFYDIARSVNDSNNRLRFHQFVDRFLSCDSMGCQWLREIQSSKRQIPSVVLEGDEDHPISIGDQLSSVVVVIEKFSPNIKFLKLWYVTIDVSTFLEILSMVPNLEHLELYTVDCPSEHQSSHKRNKRDYHDDLDLKSLKALSISWSDDKFLATFNRLPIGVLTELKIRDFHWKALMVVLSRQWNIKKLEFKFIKAANGYEYKTEKMDDLALDNFGKLTLEFLSVYVSELSSVSLATIFSKQRILKHLELYSTAVDDTIMSAIVDLAKLEILDMNLKAEKTKLKTLQKINKLKKLKVLKLECCNAVTLETIAEAVTTSIHSLTVKGR